jgi:hypothetical protein
MKGKSILDLFLNTFTNSPKSRFLRSFEGERVFTQLPDRPHPSHSLPSPHAALYLFGSGRATLLSLPFLDAVIGSPPLPTRPRSNHCGPLSLPDHGHGGEEVVPRCRHRWALPSLRARAPATAGLRRLLHASGGGPSSWPRRPPSPLDFRPLCASFLPPRARL